MRVLVVPNEGAIMGLTLTNRGMVTRWLRWLTYEVKDVAVAMTPRRTGRMATSWNAGIDTTAPTWASTRLSNSAPHAKYVLQGTRHHGAYIYPRRRAGALAVGRSQGGPVIFRKRVQTQDANNVAMDALRIVFARRGI